MGLQTAAYEAYENAMKKLCSQTRSGDVSYPDFYGSSVKCVDACRVERIALT